MATFVCEHCGEVYDVLELVDYEGECYQCGADIPKNEAEYKKELKAEIEAMASSGNEDCHAYSERL